MPVSYLKCEKHYKYWKQLEMWKTSENNVILPKKTAFVTIFATGLYKLVANQCFIDR